MKTTHLTDLRHLAWLVFSIPLLAGCVLSREAHLNAAERAMWSTCPLVTSKGMATGIVIKRRDPDAHGAATAAVVTANHFMQTVGNKSVVVATRDLDQSGEPQIALFQISATSRTTPFYVRHPAHDLAAFPLDVPADFTGYIHVPTFLKESALSRSKELPRAGTEVFFLGYPEGLPGTTGAFPVLRSGRVASYAVGSAKADGYFLIDADVYPGDSGAPVFAMRSQGRPELEGVILRRIGPNEHAPSHFAIAVTASAVRETLQLLAHKSHQLVESSAHRTTEAPHR